MSQIIIGYTTEGTTDTRLLESIILRTFVNVGFECNTQVEVVTPVVYVKKDSGEDFIEQIFQCSKIAFENGVMAFCVHVDADAQNDDFVLENKIESEDGFSCKNLLAIIPVQMTEAWMLADKQLLKNEIGTDKTDAQLGINQNPETITDPKSTILNAIRIARQSIVKRRRKDLSIAELYQPVGQKIELKKLEILPSYMKFKESVREAFRKLHYL